MFFARERFDDADAAEGFLHRNGHVHHAFLLVLNRASRPAAEESNGNDADREEDESDDRESPIEPEKTRRLRRELKLAV